MAIRYIGKWGGSPDGDSPTLWIDDDTGRAFLQGYAPDDQTTAELLGKAGKEAVPASEAIVWWPADMVQMLIEYYGEENGDGPDTS